MRKTQRLTVTYWLLKHGKPFKAFPSLKARQKYLQKHKPKAGYKLKTYVFFDLA